MDEHVLRAMSRHNRFMRKRNEIALAVLLITVAGVIAWQGAAKREPTYQGKRLSAWLDQHVRNVAIAYEDPPQGYAAEEIKKAQVRKEAETAVRHIGTNALPYLVRMIAAQDWPLKEKLMALIGRESLAAIGFPPAAHYHLMAESGFASLRAEAAPAIPDLIHLLAVRPRSMEANVANDAAYCLIMIGPAAVPALLPLTTNQNQEVRFYADSALWSIVPRLTYLVGADEMESNRRQAAVDLAAIGKADPSAAAALTQALTDKALSVRIAATNALKKLDPGAAAKAGIK